MTDEWRAGSGSAFEYLFFGSISFRASVRERTLP